MSKLSSYKPSLADRPKVGFFRSDMSCQTDSSEIVDLKEMIHVFRHLREELGDLRQDLSRSKTVLHADYDAKLSDRVIELYCRVNDKVSFLEKVHADSIDRVRHGCRTQLADAIAQIHGEHKAYLKKAIVALKAQHEQEINGANARLVNLKRQLYDYQQIINWLQSQVPQGTVRTRLPAFLLQPSNKHVLSGLSDSFKSMADEMHGAGGDTPPIGQIRRESAPNPMAPDPITKAMEDTLSDRLNEIFQLESELRERDGSIAELQTDNEQLREELTNLREMMDIQMIDDDGGTGRRWATEKEIEARLERKYALRLEALEERHKGEMQQIRSDFNESNRRWAKKLLVVQNAIYKLHDENIVATIVSKQSAVLQYASVITKHADSPNSTKGSHLPRVGSRRLKPANGSGGSTASINSMVAGSLPSLRQTSGSGKRPLKPLKSGSGVLASVEATSNDVSQWSINGDADAEVGAGALQNVVGSGGVDGRPSSPHNSGSGADSRTRSPSARTRPLSASQASVGAVRKLSPDHVPKKHSPLALDGMARPSSARVVGSRHGEWGDREEHKSSPSLAGNAPQVRPATTGSAVRSQAVVVPKATEATEATPAATTEDGDQQQPRDDYGASSKPASSRPASAGVGVETREASLAVEESQGEGVVAVLPGGQTAPDAGGAVGPGEGVLSEGQSPNGAGPTAPATVVTAVVVAAGETGEGDAAPSSSHGPAASQPDLDGTSPGTAAGERAERGEDHPLSAQPETDGTSPGTAAGERGEDHPLSAHPETDGTSPGTAAGERAGHGEDHPLSVQSAAHDDARPHTSEVAPTATHQSSECAEVARDANNNVESAEKSATDSGAPHAPAAGAHNHESANTRRSRASSHAEVREDDHDLDQSVCSATDTISRTVSEHGLTESYPRSALDTSYAPGHGPLLGRRHEEVLADDPDLELYIPLAVSHESLAVSMAAIGDGVSSPATASKSHATLTTSASGNSFANFDGDDAHSVRSKQHTPDLQSAPMVDGDVTKNGGVTDDDGVASSAVETGGDAPVSDGISESGSMPEGGGGVESVDAQPQSSS